MTDVDPTGATINLEIPKTAEWAILEYAFITSEIDGFFGTIFNDYFEVSIRVGFGPNTDSTTYVSDTNSMNGLGRGAFNSKGATFCYILSLNVAKFAGETARFGIDVANAIDNAFQSSACMKASFRDANGKKIDC